MQTTMTQAMPFGEILEAADHLSPEEQESLIAILRRRLAQAGRLRVAADVEETRQELAEGQLLPTNFYARWRSEENALTIGRFLARRGAFAEKATAG